MTNRLIEAEIGRDDGHEYPGPAEQYVAGLPRGKS